jgi:hypothetical protein
MGVIGLEQNAITSCNCSDLTILVNSGAAKSGALSADSVQAWNKSKVEIILSMIRGLTDAEHRELFQRLLKES